NVVQGNFFGTDSAGTLAVPNGFAGLTIFNQATNNTVGGLTPAARNIISGNDSYGLVIGDTNTLGNIVEGNWIGLGVNGTTPVPNGTGVLLSDGATSNIFGGATAAAGNVVSGNYYSGIYVTDPGTSYN